MMNFKRLALILAAALPLGGAAAPLNSRDEPVPSVQGKYIITLKTGVSARDIESHMAWARDVHARGLGRRDLAGVEKTYDIAGFHAYAGEFDAATIEELRNSPEVSSLHFQSLEK
jgi:oryzin